MSQHRSIWLADAPQTDYPRLTEPATCDAAVVGGGITGLTTALLLQRDGLQVVLVEAWRVGCGVTGGSTAKVTSLHGAIYQHIAARFDEHAARLYAQANQAAIEQVATLAAEAKAAGNDCQWQRQPAITFTCDRDYVELIRQEADLAQRIGLPASFVTQTDLPLPVLAALRVENQGQFHPYRYCLALAKAFEAAGGRIFEQTRVQDVSKAEGGEGCRVETDHAELSARHVVIATLLPILDRGGFFARTYPNRSYGISATLQGTAPKGMYINLESPTRSVRPLADGRGIIVVGEQHKVGHDPDTRRRYAALEEWTEQHFAVESIDHRWSAQDMMSADSIPYIGRLPRGFDRIWTATGYNKWGLTTGAVAAIILRDSIQGRENLWAGLFDSTRVDVMASAKSFIQENADVARRFVGDRLRSLAAPKLEELGSGEGTIVQHDGQKLAAYRDDSGAVHACSPLCTHMGCYVQWNTAEKSWDCPCHGSRFSFEGKVIQGPAVSPLERKEAPLESRPIP